MYDDYNNFNTQAFINIGKSLAMPENIVTDQLKRVPKKSWSGDNRRSFFRENINSEKYYYMPIGDIPQHPNRNTLVPLGTFLGFDDYNGTSGGYYMRFSISPYNNSEHGHISMEVNPLVYTDKPPTIGSVPLSYDDYIEQFYPEQLVNRRGGKKTYKRKNRKSKKTQKYKKKKRKIYK